MMSVSTQGTGFLSGAKPEKSGPMSVAELGQSCWNSAHSFCDISVVSVSGPNKRAFEGVPIEVAPVEGVAQRLGGAVLST